MKQRRKGKLAHQKGIGASLLLQRPVVRHFPQKKSVSQGTDEPMKRFLGSRVLASATKQYACHMRD